MHIDYKLIGSRIKEERKRCGLTQESLAEKLDVSIGYVSQVERGITKISLDLLGAVSSALNCDVSSLITQSAINGDNYMEGELIREFSQLDHRQRKLALEIIRLISNP